MSSNPKNFKFKHSLGQNFIIDEFLLEDIADESGITKDDFVLEIGPGNGALTKCLCDRAKYVVAVEIDKSLISLLTSNLKEYKNVTIINADFMELDFQTILNAFSTIGANQSVGANADSVGANACGAQVVGANADSVGANACGAQVVGANACGAQVVGASLRARIKVVANLPYYITSPIINILLQNPYISEMTLMVQKEVAERIVATPGGKDYGILTLACNYSATTEMIMIVSKNCFFPVPKVDSAVVHFTKHNVEANNCESLNNDPTNSDEYQNLFKLIKASFAQRRKKLLNSLTNAGYDKDTVARALSELGFDENVRAENLALDDYKKLTKFIHNYLI